MFFCFRLSGREKKKSQKYNSYLNEKIIHNQKDGKNQCVWMDRNRKYSCPLAINKLVEIDFFFFFCVPKKKSILMIYIFFFQIGFFLSAVQIIFSSSLSSFLFRVFVCYCKQNKILRVSPMMILLFPFLIRYFTQKKNG